MAFYDKDADGRFVGHISDPRPVSWDGRHLTFTAEPQLAH